MNRNEGPKANLVAETIMPNHIRIEFGANATNLHEPGIRQASVVTLSVTNQGYIAR